jgi:cell wall-associated NlpC family hydrolase
MSALEPGDLVFFGHPIHHVGMYVGNGTMIEAPYTGANVRYHSINRSDYAGATRPTG